MTRALPTALAGLAALALAACGGEDKGRPSGDRVIAEDENACEIASGYETRVLASFETTGRIASCESPWACSFYFNHDDLTVRPNQAGEGEPMVPESELCLSLTPAETDPEFAAAPAAKAAQAGPRCGVSEGVIQLKAKNVGQCYGKDGRLGWGANLEMKFVAPGNANVIQPLDATDPATGGPWDGVGFWIKRASETTNATAMVTVLDDASDGINDPTHPVDHCGCLPNPDGETFRCVTDPSKEPGFPDSAKCDPLGIAFTVTDEWSFVRASFAEMSQKGFGFPLTDLDASAIRRLQFLVNNGSSDFFIDDISLFRKK